MSEIALVPTIDEVVAIPVDFLPVDYRNKAGLWVPGIGLNAGELRAYPFNGQRNRVIRGTTEKALSNINGQIEDAVLEIQHEYEPYIGDSSNAELQNIVNLIESAYPTIISSDNPMYSRSAIIHFNGSLLPYLFTHIPEDLLKPILPYALGFHLRERNRLLTHIVTVMLYDEESDRAYNSFVPIVMRKLCKAANIDLKGITDDGFFVVKSN